MIHPLLHLIATRPQLLADHAEAYAELVGEQLGKARDNLKWRVLLTAVGLCMLAVGVVLSGVAVMLWAVVPPANIHMPWALIGTPVVPLLIAAICLLSARKVVEVSAFDSVKKQVQADLTMLRQVSAP